METIQALPSSIRTEQEIIGAIFYNPSIAAEVIEKVITEDFYRTDHKLIYNAICSLFAEGEDINLTMLINKIGKEKISDIGGVTYLTELQLGGMPIRPNSYIKILKDKSYRRQAIKSMTKAISKLHNETTKAYEIGGEVANTLTQSCDTKSSVNNDEQLFQKTLENIEMRVKKGGEIPGLKTGLNDFDKNTGGLQKGELNIVAGRPSMGKTMFSLNIAEGLAKNGSKVFLAELEMTEEALGMRRLALNANVDAERMKFGMLNDEDLSKLITETNILSKRNAMFTDCSSAQNLLTIKAKSKAIKQTQGLDVVIIDHLTLMDMPNKSTRDLAVGEVTKGLKALAKDLDVSVVLLSQLSRGVELRADKRPMLSDLRESGNIEQDADLVTFMYRDEYYNKETEDKHILECIIAKQRNGRTGTLKFAYIPQFQKVADLDYIHRN
ncbi:replicative DNA helicase [Clostridium botulinum]|uniref:Replicative DNA helicase n=1 Tax=Clostridium botulinum (strain Eklund 17B / Type B) TaxID=935198 RepID=B2TME1_CLOBB|nr:replicative DNA helicase [Clostridium botulinum B str. Eklund 17B (NRP)]MBY6976795.1 replicative DNA helicase [Clostridium botulinum]MBY7002288.1 replicative DNA helicase [Clostridium botulinum]MCR1274109.1 replicative DNA helicase [Clostridium botulinum]NFD68788.1 replicative DNA helicase [Clostridium botulinum]